MCDNRLTTPPGYAILRDYFGRWYWANNRNERGPSLASREAALSAAYLHYVGNEAYPLPNTEYRLTLDESFGDAWAVTHLGERIARAPSMDRAIKVAWRHYAIGNGRLSTRVAEKTERHARSAGSGREALDRLRAGPQYPVLPVGYRISRKTASTHVVQKRGGMMWRRVAITRTLESAMRAAWRDSQESH